MKKKKSQKKEKPRKKEKSQKNLFVGKGSHKGSGGMLWSRRSEEEEEEDDDGYPLQNPLFSKPTQSPSRSSDFVRQPSATKSFTFQEPRPISTDAMVLRPLPDEPYRDVNILRESGITFREADKTGSAIPRIAAAILQSAQILVEAHQEGEINLRGGLEPLRYLAACRDEYHVCDPQILIYETLRTDTGVVLYLEELIRLSDILILRGFHCSYDVEIVAQFRSKPQSFAVTPCAPFRGTRNQFCQGFGAAQKVNEILQTRLSSEWSERAPVLIDYYMQLIGPLTPEQGIQRQFLIEHSEKLALFLQDPVGASRVAKKNTGE
jgi:hypothetical protein